MKKDELMLGEFKILKCGIMRETITMQGASSEEKNI